MKIRYYLVDNAITPDPDDRRAQIAGYEVVTEEELFAYMTRPGSTITPAEAKANYEEIIGAFEFFLKQGCGFNTEFINIRPVMPGVFRDDDDRFEHGRHRIRFSARLGRRYNSTADDISVEKVEAPASLPLPVSFEDLTLSLVNDTLTPGGVASLTGLRLRFRQDDPEQGIFLIDSSKKEYRVERILSHAGTKVIFLLPAGLAPDEYALAVRSRTKGVKELKTGMLPERLNV